MVNIVSNSGRTAYGIQHFVVDAQEDIKTINPTAITPGSTVFVIATSKYYMLNSSKQWKEVNLSTGGGSIIPGEGDTIIYEGGII